VSSHPKFIGHIDIYCSEPKYAKPSQGITMLGRYSQRVSYVHVLTNGDLALKKCHRYLPSTQ
jgi:hypothetical protein